MSIFNCHSSADGHGYMARLMTVILVFTSMLMIFILLGDGHDYVNGCYSSHDWGHDNMAMPLVFMIIVITRRLCCHSTVQGVGSFVWE